MKVNNRLLSFLIITLAYIVASVVGITVYVMLSLDLWLKLLIADIVATTVVFVFSLIFKNASIYDPYWSVQPIVILLGIALFEKLNLIKIILLIVVCLWGVRLTANWGYTFKNLQHQDWRYTMLCEKTKKFYPIVNFLGIHIFPTLVVYLCTLPAVMLLTSNAIGNILSYVFISVSLFAIIIQGVADCQMHYFKKHKVNEKFIRIGLWKYSRHPNYLGEILMWWGVGLCSVCALQLNWFLLAGALVNTLMFLFVSIPMADKRQSQKEGFAQYKNETNILLPIKFQFKRK